MIASVPVELPSVWTPADFPDEDAWSIALSHADRQALIDYGRGGSQQDLGRHFAPAATRWAAMLQQGPGFLRLRDFPIQDLAESEIEHAYLGLGSLLGQPVGQDRHGNLITHIRDERGEHGPDVRKYRTNLRQDFHSDGSDLVGLLCLHPAKNRWRIENCQCPRGLQRDAAPRPAPGRSDVSAHAVEPQRRTARGGTRILRIGADHRDRRHPTAVLHCLVHPRLPTARGRTSTV